MQPFRTLNDISHYKMLNCSHLTNTNRFPVHSGEGGREEERAGIAGQTQAEPAA